MEAGRYRGCTFILLIVTLAFTIFFTPPVSNAEVMFIANKSVTVNTLDKTSVKKIFLGDSLVWPDGEEINLATRKNSDIQKEFTNNYLQKSEAQFTNWWRRLMFTGKGRIPRSFSSDKDIIKFVANTKGAIGYISPQDIADGIKSITISDN